jgi:hypothetical protein
MILRSFTFLLLLTFPLLCFPQKTNRYKHLERQGLWIVYHDSTNTRIDNIGKYRKGIPKGTWRYYDPEGHLIKKEKHRFRKIYNTQYHLNGKVQKKGKARIVITDNLIHYFYYDYWYEYDTTGLLLKKILYRDGFRISEIICKNGTEKNINDSLATVIQRMNVDIYKYSDSIILAKNKYGTDSREYQRYVSLSNLNALKVFDQIDQIILKYGYPGKTLVGKDYAIVFSIISSAGIKYKEKYYALIIDAADRQELDWTDVAYFVDKVKVAKKEKQVYGTQYRLGGNRLLYYPIEDKASLNERRIKKGLEEEADPLSLDDSATYD